MATNYPSSLDTSVTLPAEGATIPLSTNHVTAHQNLQDAVEAIEAKLGVDSSAVTTSHDYKLSGVTGSDKAVSKIGTETLTNKTLTSPVVNTPKITVGSDASGDIHYTSNADGTQSRLAIGTNGKILKVVTGLPSWETETVTVDASTTAKGIVEAATSSEVTAGTAIGGTGAVLAVTPDALAASTPVFNGSGLTSVKGSIITNGVSSRDMSTASGTQTIAHGCGRTPIKIKFTYWNQIPGGGTRRTVGCATYNGTTTSNIYTVEQATGDIDEGWSGTSSTVFIYAYVVASTGTMNSATVSFDSTNITLTWTKVGSPTGLCYFMWEAIA